MRNASVYCSGSIMKGPGDQKKLCWSAIEKAEVRQGAAPFSIVFLNPDDPIVDPCNNLGLFGRDMYQVMIATAVIVDARERRGIGIGVEMAAAATLGTPIVVVAPPNSLYRRDLLDYLGATVTNYVHPHVSTLATTVVDDFVAAGAAVAQLIGRGKTSGKAPAWLDSAITEYCDSILPSDAPMLEALERLGAV